MAVFLFGFDLLLEQRDGLIGLVQIHVVHIRDQLTDVIDLSGAVIQHPADIS